MGMKREYARTLQGLFSHPLQHGLRIEDVEALMEHLGATVEPIVEDRLKIVLMSGQSIVLQSGLGQTRNILGEEGVLLLRRFLQQAGISPENPEPTVAPQRGDQSKRLVIQLEHREASAWWLVDNELRAEKVKPHGIWSSNQRISHRHENDVAGQRAQPDYQYLNELCKLIMEADRVLLLGHGHGESDLRLQLRRHLEKHYPNAIMRIEQEVFDDTAFSEAEIIEVARKHFGNKPRRRVLKAPGQEVKEAGDVSL